ncbi:MAG: flagellar hook-basal body protein [Oscillospiraceae bacterium]
MTRGFYTLGSGLLTQNRTLSAISNNIANVNTPGHKKDTVLSSTFGDMVMNRVEKNRVGVGDVSMMRTVTESAKIHTQGNLKPSERNLDFAIVGSGFFAVQGENGTVYSRNGSMNLDNEGYLVLDGVGRVMGKNGPIKANTDKIFCDNKGTIYNENNEQIDSFALYDFPNYQDLITVGEGMFSGTNATPVANQTMRSKTIELSNVDVAQEMTDSIAAQRILQSISQTVKMYDKTMESATTQIGRV